MKAGYAHLDLTRGYGSEESIGAALKEYTGQRKDIWIGEKILGGMADINGTLKKQHKDARDGRQMYDSDRSTARSGYQPQR